MLSRADIDAAEQDHESAFCAPSEWARVLTAGYGCLSPRSAADAPHFLHALQRFATTLAPDDLRLEGSRDMTRGEIDFVTINRSVDLRAATVST